jgi:hypothetical protein
LRLLKLIHSFICSTTNLFHFSVQYKNSSLIDAFAYDDSSRNFRNPNPFQHERYSGLSVEIKHLCQSYNLPLNSQATAAVNKLEQALQFHKEFARTEHMIYNLWHKNGACALELKVAHAEDIEQVCFWFDVLLKLCEIATEKWYQDPLDSENFFVVLKHQLLLKYLSNTTDSFMVMYLPWIKQCIQHDNAQYYAVRTARNNNKKSFIIPEQSVNFYKPTLKATQMLFLQFIEMAVLYMWSGRITEMNRAYMHDTDYALLTLAMNRPMFSPAYFVVPTEQQDGIVCCGWIRLMALEDTTVYKHLFHIAK